MTYGIAKFSNIYTSWKFILKLYHLLKFYNYKNTKIFTKFITYVSLVI